MIDLNDAAAPAPPARYDLDAVVARLRDAAHAAVVSGAGPSVLVLTRWHPDDDRARPNDAVGVRAVTELTPMGWRVLPLEVDPAGARVVSEPAQVSS